ncbi:thiazole synthase [Heliobacterium gestii]|uniref:Thiazole synthase n=1 Tax=Heliomicrobium gestii TaxID=2699 RepID=A0A845LKP3_HELGE|nr:thiazole synthase [Heliomicrobium gestii]MBM7867489.1 thiazole synthase [Heliomicrobium gestii]MZP43963.1 thiazole synthase [Heliomicrobium gestii]
MDRLVIGGRELKSRLFIGSGKFADESIIGDIVAQTGVEIVTVALRRVSLSGDGDNILRCIPKECVLLPNTSGARTAEEAIRIARLARAAGCGDWVKIEVISDNKYLLPDNNETIKATRVLAEEGFVVLPYMHPDLYAAKELERAGAAAVMPLGAPIGTNRGLKTKEIVRILIEECRVPVIVDAGIGKPSEAAEAMEMGAAACLVNTAIATAGNPLVMARAFSQAVEAGRLAYLAQPGETTEYARASSPLTGFLRS